jgi:hypothetical protein
MVLDEKKGKWDRCIRRGGHIERGQSLGGMSSIVGSFASGCETNER